MTDTPQPAAEAMEPFRVRRPACADCGLPYTDHGWADFCVAHEVWAKLTESDDASLLCACCMVRRANRLGISAPGQFTSGPFCDDSLTGPIPATWNTRHSPAPPADQRADWVLVPQEPTEAMIEAADGWTDLIDAGTNGDETLSADEHIKARLSEIRAAYRVMLQAAPTPPIPDTAEGLSEAEIADLIEANTGVGSLNGVLCVVNANVAARAIIDRLLALLAQRRVNASDRQFMDRVIGVLHQQGMEEDAKRLEGVVARVGERG